MITTSDFRPGQTLMIGTDIFQVIEFNHNKTARGAANVKAKLKNLRSGSITEQTFNAGERFPRAQIDKTKMQYLYDSGDAHVFMNLETYEQIELLASQIENELKYIYEGYEVEVMFFQGREVIGVLLPDKIVLQVVETVPGVRGDTKTNASKDAVLQTGLVVKVPLFIDEGEKIVVSTQDGSYVSRER